MSLLIIVPTAYWVRLRRPAAAAGRRVRDAAAVRDPADHPTSSGCIRRIGGPPFPLLDTNLGSDMLLVAAYVILSFPYMYRAVDTGLAAIDVRSLTEAAQSLGAGWTRILLRVILPNLRVAILVGRLPDARDRDRRVHDRARSWRGRAFGPYLSLLGRTQRLQAGGRLAHQLRPDVARHGRHRATSAAARATKVQVAGAPLNGG